MTAPKRFIVLALSLVAGAAHAGKGTGKPPSSNPCNLPTNATASSALLQKNCTAGFKLAGFPMNSGKDATYIAKYQVDCYLDANQTIQCFFTTTTAACTAAVYMENHIEKLGTQWKFEKFEPDVGSTTGDGNCVMNVLPLPQAGPPTVQKVHVAWQAPKAARSETLSFPTLGKVPFAGPYRNQPDPPQVRGTKKIPGPVAGMSYSDSCVAVADANGNVIKVENKPLRLNAIILGMNAAAPGHGGKITSDLAGYPYLRKTSKPCIKNHPSKPGWCVEPTVLGGGPLDSPQVHHMVPAHYPGSCTWGKNSMANATVISAQLNGYFSNDYPEEAAVKQAKDITPYPTFPVGP